MKKLTVPISGINRNTDDAISIDGQCMELINARSKNGSVEPVGPPILERAYPEGTSPVYIHKNEAYEHIITRYGNNIIYDSERINGSYSNKNTLICSLPEFINIQSIGNTLILVTSNEIHYAIFINGKYTYLGDKPDFPDVKLLYSRDTSITYHEEFWCDIDPRIKIRDNSYVSLNETSTKLVNDSFRGNINKFINKLNDNGKVIYPIVARFALRLYDGKHIMHSPPILLGERNGISITVTDKTVNDGYLTDFKYKLRVQAGSYLVRYNLLSLEKWKDIITSVDIFISKSITMTDYDKDVESFFCNTSGGIEFYLNPISDTQALEKIENTTNFYKVKSIPIGGSIDLYEDLISERSVIENLEQKEDLSDDAFTRNKISGNAYVYNNRLHIANIKSQLAGLYPVDVFSKSPHTPRFLMKSEVHIKTESGIKIVHNDSLWDGQAISPYLSYPDSRAFKLVLYMTYSNGAFYKVFDLKAHPILNLAYHLERLREYDYYSDFTSGSYTPVEENNIEISPNKLKVSEVGNPFYFPSKQTYLVSSRGIVGMATATTALSTGQFGQFPLYVFTEEGVYALSVGSGDIAYQNSNPVSRDCCNNPHSIVSTDNTVIFSTNSGLMLLSGSEVNKISNNIEGYLPSCISSSPLFIKIAEIAGYKNVLSSTEFVYFLENAKIGYNYEAKEIVVSNPSYGYSYVYSLENGSWYKISVSIKSFINSYPECFAILSDGGMYNLHNRHRTVNKILLFTRPVKLGSIAYKRLLHSALRAIVKPSLSDVYFRGEPVLFREENVQIFTEVGFYILGSNDAEHFSLLSGVEKIKDIRDLITKMNKTKAYKYFAFCLVGGVRTDVAINYIEVMVDETYTNRLR